LELEKTEIKERFYNEASILQKARSLCSSLLTSSQRFESAYFEALRNSIFRLSRDKDPISLTAINARISELLKEAVKSDGVINLFSEVDLAVSLFDPKVLKEIAGMKEQNIALEILKRLIKEKVRSFSNINLVKSSLFSDLLNGALKEYFNGQISNKDVIDKLMDLAEEIKRSQMDGVDMGLTMEEKAFYDALTLPEAVKDFYENDELIAMTHELADMLRRNRTIDWQLKASAQAAMRRMVKKLLARHKYPPEDMDITIDLVLQQCQQHVNNLSNDSYPQLPADIIY
jgi:type I restriction enzyme R subunit